MTHYPYSDALWIFFEEGNWIMSSYGRFVARAQADHKASERAEARDALGYDPFVADLFGED